LLFLCFTFVVGIPNSPFHMRCQVYLLKGRVIGNFPKVPPGAGRVSVFAPAADALQELLFEEPFLYSYERIVIVTSRDHHRGLLNKPRPQLLRHSAEECANAADDHQQQAPEANWFCVSCSRLRASTQFLIRAQ
jgi:hypothetical protein